MSLLDWHRRLETHFAELRSARTSKRGADAPIFALEHGLSAIDFSLLREEIRVSIQTAPPKLESGLAWIVYATELGYDYSGEEYWQTFEERTPGWEVYGHPHWIRDRFKWFARTYGGAQPSGPWAKHFSIICWPITNAILPNDLQRQLAKILYEIRYGFSAVLLSSPLALGERIAAASWNSTSRFQKFAENALLLGQIATALLLKGELSSEGLLLPQTLERIGQDLDEERRGREWLKGARRVALERARFRGIEDVAVGGGTQRTALADARETINALGIEPTLVLRPRESTRGRWGVYLDIPELSHLLLRFPNTRVTLTQSRSRITGSNAGWLASGRVFSGTQVQLVQWPQGIEPLLEFERPAAELSFLLRTECLLRPGPLWLFRIASDGLAYEVRDHHVRPGNQYVLLSTSSFPENGILRAVTLDCEGIKGGIIEVPPAVPDSWSRALAGLGLGHSRTLSVWPAGLSPASWDGEGRAEWLLEDEPCVAIRSDHDCRSLSLTLNSGEAESQCLLPSMRAGVPAFVALAPLSTGVHALSVRDIDAPTRYGQLEIIIRPPRPWTETVTSRGLLLLDVDPAAPTLEALWDSELSIRLRGPIGRRVQCVVQLFERDTNEASISRTVPPLELPVEPQAWVEHFSRHVRGNSELQERYDVARAAEVRFAAEDLGTCILRCEREPTPLRWAVKRDYSLRLLDDSGSDSSPKVTHYPFETPDLPEVLGHEDMLRGAASHSAGGLYVAAGPDMTRGVIIPPHGRMSLADLRTQPRLAFARRGSPDEILRVVSLMSLWSEARVTANPLSSSRRRDVLRRLCRHLFLLVAGDTWDQAERRFDRSGSIATLETALRGRPDDTRLVRQMNEQLDDLAKESCEMRVRRLALAFAHALRLQVPMSPELKGRGGIVLRKPDRDNPSHPEHVTRLALRLASDPSHLENVARPDLNAGVRQLLALPTVARVARYVVLAVDRRVATSTVGPRTIYAGWEWESRR